MADGTEVAWKEYPLWQRIVMAVLFLSGGLGLGWLANDMSGLIVGGIMGLSVALLALFVPPVLALLGGILEILSYCAF